ncbi:MAG: hypothetical protein FWF76_00270 [Oscillospiraceae bacterium]|nr:hypothetical protein [Oscillospiraceae bacterium]
MKTDKTVKVNSGYEFCITERNYTAHERKNENVAKVKKLLGELDNGCNLHKAIS